MKPFPFVAAAGLLAAANLAFAAPELYFDESRREVWEVAWDAGTLKPLYQHEYMKFPEKAKLKIWHLGPDRKALVVEFVDDPDGLRLRPWRKAMDHMAAWWNETDPTFRDPMLDVEMALLVQVPHGWAAMDGADFRETVSEARDQRDELLARWEREPAPPESGGATWVPVPSRTAADVVDPLRPMHERIMAAKALAEQHPESAFALAAGLEAALHEKDPERAEKYLAALGDHPAAKYFPVNWWIVRAHQRLDYAAAGQESAMLWQKLVVESGLASGGWNLKQVVAAFEEADFASMPFRSPFSASLLWAPGQTPNFLEFQTFTKVARVYSELELLHGRPEEGARYLLPPLRLAEALINGHGETIASLIGIAMLAITEAGLEHVLLSGFSDAAALEAAAARFQTTIRFVREQEPPFADLHREAYGAPESPYANWEEAKTGWRVVQASFALLDGGLQARAFQLRHGRLPDEADLGTLPDDPFGPQPGPLLFLRPNWSTVPALVSVGPDGVSQGGQPLYDPTNGTVSAGDMTLSFGEFGRFAPPEKLGQTQAEILAQFPRGLPPDPFADIRGSSYAVSPESPARIYSYGPDVDQARAPTSPAPPVVFDEPTVSKYVTEMHDIWMTANPEIANENYWIRTGELAPEHLYDPTNGTISPGDLWLAR